MAGESQKVWHSNDIIALVAWLEFCIENKLDFRKTIASHLASLKNPSTGEEGSFTEGKAIQKLRNLARTSNAPGPAVKIRKILQLGKKCFTKLPAEVDTNITAALNTYKSKYAHLLDEKLFDREATHSKLDQQLKGGVWDREGSPESHICRENRVYPDNVSLVQDLVALDFL